MCEFQAKLIAFLDRELYLPQSWVDDAARRAEAAVPEAVALLSTATRWWQGRRVTAFRAGCRCLRVLLWLRS